MGRRSHILQEDRGDRVAATPKLPSLLSQTVSLIPARPSQARQSHPALRLLRLRRERGRQEGHLRGIDAKDIRALLTGRRGEEEGRGFREREINISLEFIVLI